MDVLKQIKEMCTTLLQAEEIQLYDVSWQQEGRNRILQIAIMREDGSMDIDTCAMMSEIISQKLDELDLYELNQLIKQIGEIKPKIQEYFDLLTLWFRDVLYMKATGDVNNLIFKDVNYLHHIRDCHSKSPTNVFRQR